MEECPWKTLANISTQKRFLLIQLAFKSNKHLRHQTKRLGAMRFPWIQKPSDKRAFFSSSGVPGVYAAVCIHRLPFIPFGRSIPQIHSTHWSTLKSMDWTMSRKGLKLATGIIDRIKGGSLPYSGIDRSTVIVFMGYFYENNNKCIDH